MADATPDTSAPPISDETELLSNISADRDETVSAINATNKAYDAADYPEQLKNMRAASDKDEDAMQGVADQRLQNLEQPFQGQAPQRQANILSNLAPLLLVTAMGGKATKLNAGNMFAASSGIAQGYLQGNEELYQENVKKYQDSYKAFMDHQEQQDKMLKIYEDAYKDRIDYRQKAIEATLKTMDDQYSRSRNLVEDKDRLDQATATIKENHDRLVDENYFKNQELKMKQKAQADQDSHDALVKAIGEYRQPPPSPGNRSAASQKLLAEVMEKYPNYDYTNWQQKSKAVQSFSTGKQGDTTRALNVAVQHLGVLDDLSKALQNGDTKQVNRLANAYAEQTGGAAPTNFNLAKQVIATEVIKATAGSVGALGDRDAVLQQIQASESPAQLAGAIQTAKRLMSGQLKGLEKQYTQATGLSNFRDKLAPETVNALETDPSPGANAAPASTVPTATNAKGDKVYLWGGKWQLTPPGGQ